MIQICLFFRDIKCLVSHAHRGTTGYIQAQKNCTNNNINIIVQMLDAHRRIYATIVLLMSK